MDRNALIAYALTLPDAVIDAPFEDPDIVALRRRSNRRWFALFMTVRGASCVNLKCEPRRADLYRHVYRDVTPGWHMNKTHWNTVRLGGDVPDDELTAMVAHSYALVGPRRHTPK